MFSYHNPVRVQFGVGIYAQVLERILGSARTHNVGLFYSLGAVAGGVLDTIKQTLSHCKIHEYGGVCPNPDLQSIEMILDGFRMLDLVIGIGGGSTLDFAKSVAFMVRQQESLRTFLMQQNTTPARPPLPIIAIPTTSGTGSEVTPWATIWDFQEKKKHSLFHPQMFPYHAIIDPSLARSLPPYVTAYTGYDALCHALEAYWSRHSNPISDLYAIQAIQLVFGHLEQAVKTPTDEHRIAMAKASLYAGLAFSNTGTTAVHAVSYPMTLHYGVPHGVACSLTLEKFWHYNLESVGARRVSRLLMARRHSASTALADRFQGLAQEIDLPTTLQAAGIPREGIDVIVEEGFHERVLNNPRELTREDLRGILEDIYD